MGVTSEAAPPPQPRSAAEPGRTRKEPDQGTKVSPAPSSSHTQTARSRTPAPSDVLSAKLGPECPHLVVGDPPSTGDNTGVPGRAVTQGHRARLRQGSRRDRFTCKATPSASVNAIHAQRMEFSNFHTRPNPARELSRRPGQKYQGATDTN